MDTYAGEFDEHVENIYMHIMQMSALRTAFTHQRVRLVLFKMITGKRSPLELSREIDTALEEEIRTRKALPILVEFYSVFHSMYTYPHEDIVETVTYKL